MFDSRIANVVAYAGLALVLLVPIADHVMGLSTRDATPAIEDTPAPAQPAAMPAPAVPQAEPATRSGPPPARVVVQPPVEQPPGDVIRPGTRIQMTEEQIRGPQAEPTQPPEPAAAAATVPSPAKVAPVPRPLSERPRPQVDATPDAPASTVMRPQVIQGAPERPLGTMPAQGYPSGPLPPAEIPIGNTVVDDLRGWTDGNLEDYLARQRGGNASPEDRFVPPANVGN